MAKSQASTAYNTIVSFPEVAWSKPKSARTLDRCATCYMACFLSVLEVVLTFYSIASAHLASPLPERPLPLVDHVHDIGPKFDIITKPGRQTNVAERHTYDTSKVRDRNVRATKSTSTRGLGEWKRESGRDHEHWWLKDGVDSIVQNLGHLSWTSG